MALGYRVQGRHADAGREVLYGLGGRLEGQLSDNSLVGVLDVDDVVLDAEGVDEKLRLVDIRLLAVGHQHADDSVPAQRFYA